MLLQKMVTDGERRWGERGASLLELAILLPVLVVLAFGLIDLGQLIHARLVMTNVSREGGSLAARSVLAVSDLATMLQSSAKPFDLSTRGKIYITKIKAADPVNNHPFPYIDSKFATTGGYAVNSSIGGNVGQTPTGLSTALMDHLLFEPAPQNASDISEITVVEVFYHYTPITPLPNFVQNVFPDNGGILIGSRAIFN
jgi:hypothetical protein